MWNSGREDSESGWCFHWTGYDCNTHNGGEAEYLLDPESLGVYLEGVSLQVGKDLNKDGNSQELFYQQAYDNVKEDCEK